MVVVNLQYNLFFDASLTARGVKFIRHWEWLGRRVDELKDVGRVLGMRLAEELATVPGIDKELDRIP